MIYISIRFHNYTELLTDRVMDGVHRKDKRGGMDRRAIGDNVKVRGNYLIITMGNAMLRSWLSSSY